MFSGKVIANPSPISLSCQLNSVGISGILFRDYIRYSFADRNHQLLSHRKVTAGQSVFFLDAQYNFADILIFTTPVSSNIPKGVPCMNCNNLLLINFRGSRFRSFIFRMLKNIMMLKAAGIFRGLLMT